MHSNRNSPGEWFGRPWVRTVLCILLILSSGTGFSDPPVATNVAASITATPPPSITATPSPTVSPSPSATPSPTPSQVGLRLDLQAIDAIPKSSETMADKGSVPANRQIHGRVTAFELNSRIDKWKPMRNRNEKQVPCVPVSESHVNGIDCVLLGPDGRIVENARVEANLVDEYWRSLSGKGENVRVGANKSGDGTGGDFDILIPEDREYVWNMIVSDAIERIRIYREEAERTIDPAYSEHLFQKAQSEEDALQEQAIQLPTDPDLMRYFNFIGDLWLRRPGRYVLRCECNGREDDGTVVTMAVAEMEFNVTPVNRIDSRSPEEILASEWKSYEFIRAYNLEAKEGRSE